MIGVAVAFPDDEIVESIFGFYVRIGKEGWFCRRYLRSRGNIVLCNVTNAVVGLAAVGKGVAYLLPVVSRDDLGGQLGVNDNVYRLPLDRMDVGVLEESFVYLFVKRAFQALEDAAPQGREFAYRCGFHML